MRLLHLAVELPRANGPGGAIRQLQLLSRLAETGHEVTVLAPVIDGAPATLAAAADLAAAGIDFRPVARPTPRPLELARALRCRPRLAPAALGQPWFAWQFEVMFEWLRARLPALVAELRPEAIVVEHDDLAGWEAGLPAGVPRVLSAHNVTWRLLERRAQAARGARRLALRAEAARHRRYVGTHLPRYDQVIAVSREDAVELTALGARRVAVVGNGADLRAFSPAPESTGPPTLLFVGSLDHPPNPEGILWFAREAWPHVVERVPDSRLLVAGRGPQERLDPLRGLPGVELAGEVPSVAACFASASAVIAPLLSGGGTKLKVLDAFAAGRAVVATSIGAAGIDAADGEHLLVADGATAFADACVRTLTDADLRESLARNGRALAEAEYDWRALGDRLAAALDAAARPDPVQHDQ